MSLRLRPLPLQGCGDTGGGKSLTRTGGSIGMTEIGEWGVLSSCQFSHISRGGDHAGRGVSHRGTLTLEGEKSLFLTDLGADLELRAHLLEDDLNKSSDALFSPPPMCMGLSLVNLNHTMLLLLFLLRQMPSRSRERAGTSSFSQPTTLGGSLGRRSGTGSDHLASAASAIGSAGNSSRRRDIHSRGEDDKSLAVSAETVQRRQNVPGVGAGCDGFRLQLEHDITVRMQEQVLTHRYAKGCTTEMVFLLEKYEGSFFFSPCSWFKVCGSVVCLFSLKFDWWFAFAVVECLSSRKACGER